MCEGAEPLTDQEFAAILSCGYYIASYEKPDFAKGQAFESLYFLDMHLDGDAVTAAVKKMLKDPACGHIFRVKVFAESGWHMAGDQCNTAGDHAKADCKWAGCSDCDRRESCGRHHPGVLERLETDDDLCDDGALSGGTGLIRELELKKNTGVCAV